MIHTIIDTAGSIALPTSPEPALAHALADALVALTSQLADLAYDLAGNPDTLRHHMHSLQSIDRITQAQLAVADLLRAPGTSDDALKTVTLEDLAGTLREALDRYRLDGTPAV